MPSPAVTFTVTALGTVVERFTWCPSVPVSASAGVIVTEAPESSAAAVTVVTATEFATLAVYDVVFAPNAGERVTSERAREPRSAFSSSETVTETSPEENPS